jgi:hypothetical protein
VAGILWGVALPNYQRGIERTHWRTARSTLHAIYQGAQQYFAIHGCYAPVAWFSLQPCASGNLARQAAWRQRVFLDDPQALDGSVTYRLLSGGVMTEYVPSEERNGVVQVSVLKWDGPIDRSGFD